MNRLEHIPEGLVAGDTAQLQTKIADFIGAAASGVHMVFDFDRTLTIRNAETQDDITTWHILREHLPEVAKQQYQNLYEKYRVLEIEDTMTVDDAAEWWSAILDLFVENKLDLGLVEQDFLARASIRPAVAELFSLCEASNIPTIVMSAGIRDVIDIWNKTYSVNPSLVLSTALKLDDDNKITGWYKDTLIHVLNKSEADHPELNAIRLDRPKAIIVGDSINDADMALGDCDVLRVRILDPRPDEVVDKNSERQKTFKRFDALIESGSMKPLVDLIQMIITPEHT